MSEETTAEPKEENKFVSFLKKHFSKIWKAIVGVFLGFVGIIVYKKVDKIITINDNKKKEEIKSNISGTKDSINKSSETASEIKEDVSKMKEELNRHTETVDTIKQEYAETQIKEAENAGFKKK